MEKYEIMYLFSPKIEEKEIEMEIQKANKAILESGGEITKEDFWGLKDLAYPIRKFEHGYYHTLWFNFPKNYLSKLEAKFKLMPHLLRFLVTKPKTKTIPTPTQKIKKKMKAEVGPKIPPKPSATKKSTKKEKAKQIPSAKPSAKVTKETKPQPAPLRDAEKTDLQELDKKLDEILNEKIL